MFLAILATLSILSPSPAYHQIIQRGGQHVALPNIERVVIVASECPALARSSCVIRERPTTIYFDPTMQSKLVLHELAHVYDFTTMLEWQRIAFLRIMKYKRGWESQWVNSKLTLPGGSELFADAYMSCAIGDGKVYTVYSWRPSVEQYRKVCHMIRKR